ncbi:MAG: hypothetical protein ACRED9_05630 [Caulobacteraceae bacterium]
MEDRPFADRNSGPPGEQAGAFVPLDDPRRERFCQALAGGAAPNEAAREAGFSWAREGRRLLRSPTVARRIDAIRVRQVGRASRDLCGIIDGLVETALEARRSGTPQGALAARFAYEAAAKLKQLLPEPATSAEFIGPDRAPDAETELTEAEWLAKFGPVPPLKNVER